MLRPLRLAKDIITSRGTSWIMPSRALTFAMDITARATTKVQMMPAAAFRAWDAPSVPCCLLLNLWPLPKAERLARPCFRHRLQVRPSCSYGLPSSPWLPERTVISAVHTLPNPPWRLESRT